MTHSLDLTERALADRTDPPLFRQTCQDFTFTVGVGRMSRWCRNGMKGLPTDPQYDKPTPRGGTR